MKQPPRSRRLTRAFRHADLLGAALGAIAVGVALGWAWAADQAAEFHALEPRGDRHEVVVDFAAGEPARAHIGAAGIELDR